MRGRVCRWRRPQVLKSEFKEANKSTAVDIAVLASMMLASCGSIPDAFNPFAPATTTTSTSDPPITSQTNRPTYEMPLGRNPENYVPASDE
jgi:hypothetical protein